MQRLRRLGITVGGIALVFMILPSVAAAQFGTDVRLTGQAEAPPAANGFRGSCHVVLNLDLAQLAVNCSHDVVGATGAHIHRGERGENGPVVFNLGDPASPIQDVTLALEPGDVSDYLNGNFYINIHNGAFPDGAVRGQIDPGPPVDGALLRFPLEPGQEVPPVAEPTSGECTVVLGARQETLRVDCQHDVEDAVGAHIHMGARGTNGPVIVDLGDPASPVQAVVDLTDPQYDGVLAAIGAGDAYVNVHSPEFSDGEIRGQVEGCVAGELTLCLRDRFEVSVDWATGIHETGRGHAVPETNDSGLFWFFSPSNTELLVKVLNGCGINDHFWVFFAGTTDVAFTLTVRDTVADTTVTYENVLGDPADSTNDIEAFATCGVSGAD